MNLKWRLEDLLVIRGWLWLCLGSQLQNFQTVVPMNELGPPSRIWPRHPMVPVGSDPPLKCLAVNSTFNSEHIQWMLNVFWCTICSRISSCSHCRSILGTTCFSRCDNHSANITPSFSELPSCHLSRFISPCACTEFAWTPGLLRPSLCMKIMAPPIWANYNNSLTWNKTIFG